MMINFCIFPSRARLKSGIPALVEMPAPQSTTTCRASAGHGMGIARGEWFGSLNWDLIISQGMTNGIKWGYHRICNQLHISAHDLCVCVRGKWIYPCFWQLFKREPDKPWAFGVSLVRTSSFEHWHRHIIYPVRPRIWHNARVFVPSSS